MISLKDFNEKEAKGLVTLVRVTSDAMAISTKQFDVNTGAELSEVVVGGNIKEYLEKKEALLAEVAEIDAFVRKFKALTAQDAGTAVPAVDTTKLA